MIIRSDVPDIQSLVQNVSPVVVAHAANTLDGVPPVTLTILSKTLPDALTQTPYNASISFIGGKGALAWTLASGSLPPGLTLDPSTGAIAGTATATGDYPFTAQVTDSAATPNVAQQAFTIHAAQLLAFTTNTLPDAIIGMPYSANIPAGGGTGNLTFSLLSGAFPDGLSMDATGVISGTSLASNVAGSSFNVQVQVQDTGNPPQIVHATLTMRAFAVLSAGPGTTTLPDAVAGQPYSATLAASGGNGPFNWTIISGALPANLILNSATGGISGTPQAGGNSSFTATVQDQSNPPQTGNTTVNLNVVTPLVINIGGGSLPDGVVGTPYFATLTPLGGTGPFTFTLNGSLPAGLSLSAAGVISGTPTSPNFHATPSSFSVTAQDSGAPPQSATTQLLTIRIGAKLMVTTTSLPNASPGVAYNQTLTATGGLGNYTWSLNSGALPAGLTLSSGGVISGTPTSTGTSSFTVQVTDGTLPTSQVATQPLSIAVNTIYNIVFYVQPSNTKASYDIYPDVKVKVTDANGKAVKGVVCQMTIAVNPGGGVLTGMTVSTTNRNGIAVFDDLFINKQGTGYKLQVTITNPAGGGSAISVPFNIL